MFTNNTTLWQPISCIYSRFPMSPTPILRSCCFVLLSRDARRGHCRPRPTRCPIPPVQRYPRSPHPVCIASLSRPLKAQTQFAFWVWRTRKREGGKAEINVNETELKARIEVCTGTGIEVGSNIGINGFKVGCKRNNVEELQGTMM